MNSLCILLPPQVSNMISSLEATSVINTDFTLIMIIIFFYGWNMIFPSATLLNYFHIFTTPLDQHQLILHSKMTALEMPMPILLQYAFLMPNTKKNIQDVAFDQHHLSLDQCQDLFNVLSKLQAQKIFDGFLGVYPHKKVCIDFKPLAKLVHHHTYPVPNIHWQTFKKELHHWSNLVFLNHVGPLNGHPLPSLFKKGWNH